MKSPNSAISARKQTRRYVVVVGSWKKTRRSGESHPRSIAHTHLALPAFIFSFKRMGVGQRTGLLILELCFVAVLSASSTCAMESEFLTNAAFPKFACRVKFSLSLCSDIHFNGVSFCHAGSIEKKTSYVLSLC